MKCLNFNFRLKYQFCKRILSFCSRKKKTTMKRKKEKKNVIINKRNNIRKENLAADKHTSYQFCTHKKKIEKYFIACHI